MAGKAYLIGAGPGDAGLITVRGARALQTADVVIFDYLSNQELLSYAREDAKFIFVGKKGFAKHITQEEINELLVDEARDAVVARLKGGDPFVFGRGGEEALALAAAGIEFEVIPGVTSGIAAPAAAGIPVTHRGVSTSVAFVTGNEDPTKLETDIDWNGIAHGAQTLCFYMGIRNLDRITSKLIEAGKAPDTPVALVRWGTLPQQEVLTGTLADIARRAQEANFQAPAIIVVGEVVELREQLRRDDTLPLAGHTIAVTRSRTQASVLVEKLRELGAQVIECPTIEIEPLDDYGVADAAIAQIAVGSYDWLVLTSVNGVEHFFARLDACGLDTRALADVSIAAIGSATQAALAEHGIKADLVPGEYRAEAIADELIEQGVGEGAHVLIARAQVAREMLPEALADAGARVDVVALYRTVPASGHAVQRALDAIGAGEVDSITFTSTSTVRNFVKLMGDDAAAVETLARLRCYSIGPITTAALEEYGAHAHAEANPYTIPVLVDTILLTAAHER
jgi:uroporphyrinogen III methyltransferase/synthase